MVPEGRGVFTRMTIVENLQMGAYIRDDKAAIAEDIERVFTTFPRLKERRDQLAGTMSGGEQQMLAMARILRSGARILLLDEITEGLAPVIVQTLGRVIRQLKAKGLTIVLVEQNFRFAAPLADRHYVMEHGQIVATVHKNELDSKAQMLNEYLGV
jgi:branched-chain amino acid transport system ATP-binding protein